MTTIFLMTALFGWERQLEHKPVGFGVYGFVGCSACALTIVDLGTNQVVDTVQLGGRPWGAVAVAR